MLQTQIEHLDLSHFRRFTKTSFLLRIFSYSRSLISICTSPTVTRWTPFSLVLHLHNPEVKYLGKILNDKPTWDHIERQSQKYIFFYWTEKGSFGKAWNLNPRVTLCIYIVIIVPFMLDASRVWMPTTRQAFTRKRLERQWLTFLTPPL